MVESVADENELAEEHERKRERSEVVDDVFAIDVAVYSREVYVILQIERSEQLF